MKKTASITLILALNVIRSSAADVREGLISYWPLDTTSADFTSTPDMVSKNHLTLANFDASVLVDGKRGKAFQFDGDVSQRYAYYTNPEGVDNGLPISRNRGYSVLFWVKGKGTGQSDRRMFSESSSTANDPLVNLGTHNGAADDTVDIYIRNSGTQVNHVHSPKAGLDDQWHHLAWTYENGQGRLYIDGALDYTANYNPGPTPYDTTSIGGILRASPSHYFTGLIDDVALWERALTVSEVQTVMSSGIEIPVPSFAPAITLQPKGSADLVIGDSYTLTASAVGTRPVTYQWRKNNTPIANATGSTLTLSKLTEADSGEYTFVASNSTGSVNSQAAVLVVKQPPPPDLSKGLVSYWPLDEVQGVKTPDAVSGYDMELINLSAADLVNGKRGKAFQFANSRQTMLERINLPADDLPIYKHPNFSISLWVNGPSFQQDLRVFSEASTTVNTPLFNIGTHNTAANGAVDIYIRNDANQQGGHRFSVVEAYDDTWHHIVYVQRDVGGAMQAALYIDGTKDEVALDPRRPMTVNSTSIGGIRRGARSFWFNGMIDEVSLWKRALSDQEITKLFAEGTPKPASAVTQPLAIRSFKSSLAAVAKGDPITLSWDLSKDATQVEIDQGIGNVLSSTVVGIGKITLPLSDSKAFTLTANRGSKSVTAKVAVEAVEGVAANWALLERFDQYPVGRFPSTWWSDLGGNSAVANVNGNRMLNMRGTGRVALLPLGDLTVKEGQQRTLFARLYVQGNASQAVLSFVGLTDRPLRFVTDATDAGGVGPTAQLSTEMDGQLMVGARNGVGGTRDLVPPVLETGGVYNIWIDVRNDSVASGDTFSIWMQKEGEATRTKLFTDYVTDRDPAGNPPGAGGGPTLPDLDKVFLGNHAVNAVFFDDIYISKSGLNSTIPRAFAPASDAQPVTLSVSRTGNDIELRWPAGTLESAASVTGPWSAVAAAAAPSHRIALSSNQQFFRVRR